MIYVHPCPWCGEDAKFNPGGGYVECTDYRCGARGPAARSEHWTHEQLGAKIVGLQAIELWNIVAIVCPLTDPSYK